MAVSQPRERILIRIEVHIDTLCPWCYIQKRSLDTAMRKFQDQHPEVEFEVLWRPFYLYPMLEEGCDKATLYGPESRPNNFYANRSKIEAAGLANSIAFSIKGATGPSRLSHQLIALALQQRDATAQAAVVDALFRGHFEKGEDLTDLVWLVSVGVTAGGLDGKDVKRVLESEEAGCSVDEEVRSASVERQVKAVPCVTMQGLYRVGGYQEEHVFTEQFHKMWKNGGK